jgi:hypothetical protein
LSIILLLLGYRRSNFRLVQKALAPAPALRKIVFAARRGSDSHTPLSAYLQHRAPGRRDEILPFQAPCATGPGQNIFLRESASLIAVNIRGNRNAIDAEAPPRR